MIAVSLFLILIVGIFAIAKGTMELSTTLIESQERALTRQNFIEFLRESFRRLPGDAEVILKNSSQGSSYVPTLSIFSGGDAFSPGPAISPEGSVELFAGTMPGGALRVGLRMLDDKQTASARQGNFKRSGTGSGDIVLPLMENVQRFELKFLNPQTQQWEYNWKSAQRPTFAELNLVLEDGVLTRQVFWIPPIIRRQQNGLPVPGPGGPGQPGAPNQPPGATPNTNPNVNPVPQLKP
jgi:hypothetical protein